MPGAELNGIHTIRTLEDAFELREELRAARQVVVVGAGFIGLEVAAIARRFNLATTVLPGSSAPLGRAVSPPLPNGLQLTMDQQASISLPDKVPLPSKGTTGGLPVSSPMTMKPSVRTLSSSESERSPTSNWRL